MRSFLFYILGSIYFKAQGGFSERFLNLCHVKGVKLFDLTEKEGVLFARTSLSSFRKIRLCARRSGMRIKILEKKGLPFVYARFSKRVGLFAGIAASCFLLFFYSRSIWSIEVEGNQAVSAAQIKQVLAQNGIREGTLKNKLDHDALSFALYEGIPEIAWLNLGVDGSRLTVNIREVVEKPAYEDEKQYCNIVARAGGVIDTLRVYAGESLVHEGDGVYEGQLLVSGVPYHEAAKKNSFHKAKADIFAYVEVQQQFSIPKTYRKTTFTGREAHYKVLRLFRLRVPLYLFTDHFAEKELSCIQKPLVIRGRELPLGIEEYAAKEQRSTKQAVDRETAAVFARTKAAKFEKTFAPDTRIKQRKIDCKEKKDAFVFTYSYTLYENIAVSVPIEMQADAQKD